MKVETLKDWLVSDIHTHSYCRQQQFVAVQNSCLLFIILYTQKSNAAVLSFYAVIDENEKRMSCALLYKSYGMQISDALGSYFRFW